MSIRQFAPPRRRIAPQGLAPFKPGAAGYSSLVDTQDLPGSCAIRSMPLPRSLIPASPTVLTVAPDQFRPH